VCYSRPGNDLTYRFPLIVETLTRLRSRSCIIEGEAVACDDNGVTSFDRVHYRHHDESIFFYAIDLIELNGDDLRRDPLERRKATLEMILAKAAVRARSNPFQGNPPCAPTTPAPRANAAMIKATACSLVATVRARSLLRRANSRKRRCSTSGSST
jgi:ATP-dependent DNA ligase